MRREVLEETAVVVGEVEYRGSQPWPFPASLMVGFRARAVTVAVTADGHELGDARWFTREEIAASRTLLPPSHSISYRLVERWFDSGSETTLASLRGT